MKSISLHLFFTFFLILSTAPVIGQVPDYLPENGLVGWWPFNGNSLDESNTGNDGMVNGALLTKDRFGNTDKAYSFDGENDHIDIPYSSSLYHFEGTVNLWIKPDEYFGEQKMIYGQSRGRPQINISSSLSNADNGVAVQWTAEGFSAFPGVGSLSSADTGSWTMVTGVYAVDTFRVFVNGVLENTFVTDLDQDNCVEDIGIFQIGGFYVLNNCSPGGPIEYSQMFKGKIDDIAVWGRILGTAEINGIYDDSVTGLNSYDAKNEVKIYPNPADHFLFIDIGEDRNCNNCEFRVTNTLGQAVLIGNMTDQTSKIELPFNSYGTHFISILDLNNDNVYTQKVFLNRN